MKTHALSLILLVACSSLAGDPLAMAHPSHGHSHQAPAPYHLDIVGEHGNSLPTWQHRGRTYVLGDPGERYSIRVTNPTAQRIEAVVSVDGLDAIDGRTAGVDKRGYLIAPYGELRVDGFRVSTEEVATFRFSSVSESYAGKKGQARNVGVIGVAIFTENEPPRAPVYVPTPDRLRGGYDGDGRRGGDDSGSDREDFSPSSGGSSPPMPTNKGVAKAESPSAGASGRADRSESRDKACCGNRPNERPGLGTRFGEARTSRVEVTRFDRQSPQHPATVLELRYNDERGLVALGIRVRPPVRHWDRELRETASPFPSTFASPPPGWQ